MKLHNIILLSVIASGTALSPNLTRHLRMLAKKGKMERVRTNDCDLECMKDHDKCDKKCEFEDDEVFCKKGKIPKKCEKECCGPDGDNSGDSEDEKKPRSRDRYEYMNSVFGDFVDSRGQLVVSTCHKQDHCNDDEEQIDIVGVDLLEEARYPEVVCFIMTLIEILDDMDLIDEWDDVYRPCLWDD